MFVPLLLVILVLNGVVSPFAGIVLFITYLVDEFVQNKMKHDDGGIGNER